MSAQERAAAEKREAEEQRRQNEARLARERQQAAERAGRQTGVGRVSFCLSICRTAVRMNHAGSRPPTATAFHDSGS